MSSYDKKRIKKERDKARQLRKTRWWQKKTSSGRCYYCGRAVGFSDLTMDHVIPLSRGGNSSKDNLVPCCKTCNTKKRSSLPVEWKEYMERLNKIT
ncbi:MAG: HNH endonuclease [Desulfobulbus propionicus]|nr:MAG: HNH endonuclease [Desulfobulbus propionicus]